MVHRHIEGHIAPLLFMWLQKRSEIYKITTINIHQRLITYEIPKSFLDLMINVMNFHGIAFSEISWVEAWLHLKFSFSCPGNVPLYLIFYDFTWLAQAKFNWHNQILVNWDDWLTINFNSLWPIDTIWWHRSGSTLAQVMACCLMPPSHYLHQCWLIIGKVQLHPASEIQEIPQPSITTINWKVTYLKFHSNLSGANELTHWSLGDSK